MAKRALLIGCNYPGTKAELHGCVNDVSRMYKSLIDRFGFEERDVTVMVDTDRRSVQPTGANIKKVLGRLISESEEGDILVLHYSGHGTQVPAESGDDEDDGLDEAIVPTDLNLMTDSDFRILLKDLQPGVAFTFISDSCHSGGLLDQEKEQIGGGDGGTRSFNAPPAQSRGYGTRSYGGASEYEPRGERREYGGYGRREEPEYESRGERREYGGYGRGEEPEYESRGERREYGGYGRGEEPEYGYGRREEPAYGEYESRGERREYGGYGRGEEPEDGYGRREEPAYGEYESRGERHGHHEQGGYGRREEAGYGEHESRGEGYGRHENVHRHGRREEEDYQERMPSVNKSLSIQTLAEMLSERAGHEVQPGNIRTSLYDVFGEDASPTVKVFVNLISSRLSGGGGGGEEGGMLGVIGGLAMDFLKTKLDGNDSGYSQSAQALVGAVNPSGHAGVKPAMSERLSPDVGVLVSGCQSNETSADANPTGNPAQAYGALSNGIQEVLAGTQGPISYGQLVTGVRDLLKKQGFAQHPCLFSSDRNVNATFICE